jgi:hypothetical protein
MNNIKDILKIIGCLLGIVGIILLFFIPINLAFFIILVIVIVITILKYVFRIF